MYLQALATLYSLVVILLFGYLSAINRQQNPPPAPAAERGSSKAAIASAAAASPAASEDGEEAAASEEGEELASPPTPAHLPLDRPAHTLTLHTPKPAGRKYAYVTLLTK